MWFPISSPQCSTTLHRPVMCGRCERRRRRMRHPRRIFEEHPPQEADPLTSGLTLFQRRGRPEDDLLSILDEVRAPSRNGWWTHPSNDRHQGAWHRADQMPPVRRSTRLASPVLCRLQKGSPPIALRMRGGSPGPPGRLCTGNLLLPRRDGPRSVSTIKRRFGSSAPEPRRRPRTHVEPTAEVHDVGASRAICTRCAIFSWSSSIAMGCSSTARLISNAVLARALTAEGLPTTLAPIPARLPGPAAGRDRLSCTGQARPPAGAGDWIERYERDRTTAFRPRLCAVPGVAAGDSAHQGGRGVGVRCLPGQAQEDPAVAAADKARPTSSPTTALFSALLGSHAASRHPDLFLHAAQTMAAEPDALRGHRGHPVRRHRRSRGWYARPFGYAADSDATALRPGRRRRSSSRWTNCRRCWGSADPDLDCCPPAVVGVYTEAGFTLVAVAARRAAGGRRAHYGVMARLPPVSTVLSLSARGRVLLRVCVFAIIVAQERRSIAKGSDPGVFRRVDARTGAAPSLPQTIVVLGMRDVIRWLIRAIPGPGAKPRRPDPGLQRELVRARAEHADDPDALREAVVRVYRERRVTPASMGLSALVRGVVVVAANRAPIPFLAERRTIADVFRTSSCAEGRHAGRACAGVARTESASSEKARIWSASQSGLDTPPAYGRIRSAPFHGNPPHRFVDLDRQRFAAWRTRSCLTFWVRVEKREVIWVLALA